ncbi:unnamed protein product [Alternaria burnsii]|nr:unnamed protein product [Alternaria burnsii]
MSHHTLNNFLHHPSISNLVELYEPIRYFSRTPRTAQEKPLLSDGHFRRSVYHETSFSSDFELRETSEAYFLEGEFPGISGGTAIKVHWLDERTLRVKGIIHKTDLKTEWDAGPAENRSQDQPESPQYRRDVDDED